MAEEDVHHRPDQQPAGACGSDFEMQRGYREEREQRSDATDDREQRKLPLPHSERSRSSVRARSVGGDHSEPNHR